MADIIANAVSKFGKSILLTSTIWEKIKTRHLEFAQTDCLGELRETVNDPDYVVAGWTDEYLALRWSLTAPSSPKYLCVVYRETNGEGFVITAFFISRHERLLRRQLLWQRNPN